MVEETVNRRWFLPNTRSAAPDRGAANVVPIRYVAADA
jgi:hypothetical protein